MKFRVLGIMAGVALLAGACTDAGLIDTVEGMKPTEKGFKSNLHHQYVTLSKGELEEGDHFDAGFFARRAEAAAMGKDVLPDSLWDRSFSSKQLASVHSERGRLMKALDGGGREKFPGIAARAQTQFDCWVQELEENTQPEDIKKCRSGYDAAIAALEEALKPKPMMKKPEPKPAPAPAPAPKAEVPKGPFIVYFDFDSDEVKGAETGVTLVKAARSIAANKATSVIVVGHTDSAGRDSYNQKLAARRAANVREALIGLDVEPSLIDPVSVGESGQEKKTGDGVREDANRRVVIKLY